MGIGLYLTSYPHALGSCQRFNFISVNRQTEDMNYATIRMTLCTSQLLISADCRWRSKRPTTNIRGACLFTQSYFTPLINSSDIIMSLHIFIFLFHFISLQNSPFDSFDHKSRDTLETSFINHPFLIYELLRK